MFVDEDAKLNVSFKIAIVPADRTVGDGIEALVGDGEANDGIDLELAAALAFPSTWMAAVAGDSDVGTGLGSGKIGIVIRTVS